MDFSKRLIVFWSDDSWLSSLDPCFHEALLSNVEKLGNPSHMEFREGTLRGWKETLYERSFNERQNQAANG